jgi:hypothetical protein
VHCLPPLETLHVSTHSVKENTMSKVNYELLREAYAIIGGIPDEVFDLETIVKRRGDSLACGTICCAAGWLAHHPEFNARGLTVEGRSLHWKGESHLWQWEVAIANVFGIGCETAEKLFGMRGYGLLGRKEVGVYSTLSDKELWLLRVRTYLERHGQTTRQLQEKARVAA